jgi:hypothetical protein
VSGKVSEVGGVSSVSPAGGEVSPAGGEGSGETSTSGVGGVSAIGEGEGAVV